MATEVTELLRRWHDGDAGALNELMPLVYRELRRVAQAYLRNQPPGQTLQPTSLINEAYLKGSMAPSLDSPTGHIFWP